MKFIASFLALVAIAVGGYFFYKSHAVVEVTNKPALPESGGDQATLLADTLTALNSFIVLPTNETPILAVVTDPKELQGESFFAQAQTGDRVLVYKENRKAILYRPSIKKIIEIESIPESVATTPAH